MKATVRTQYLGPTDTRGSRVRVTGPNAQLTVVFDHNVSDMHMTALLRLYPDAAVIGEPSERFDGYTFTIETKG